MAGPNPAFDLHPVQPKTAFYRTSEMCGRCHEAAYAEWQAAPTPADPFSLVQAGEFADTEPASAVPAKPTCQSCHMEAVTRRQTDKKPFDKLHPAYPGRRHIFSATEPRLVTDALALDVLSVEPTERGLAVRVAVTNARALHNVPTGMFGHRQVNLLATAEDSGGRAATRARESFLADLGTALRPGERREVELVLRPRAVPVRLKLSAQRVDRDGRTVATLGQAESDLHGRLDLPSLQGWLGTWAALAQAEDPRPARTQPAARDYRRVRPGPMGLVLNDLLVAWAWAQRATSNRRVGFGVAVGLAVLLMLSVRRRRRRRRR
jgi:hypothetical protein